MRKFMISINCLLLFGTAYAAVKNGSFTAMWAPPTDPRAIYEFRWRNFAQSEWQALPDQPSSALSFRYEFSPLPSTPITDRWFCIDARVKLGDQVGPWLSNTPDGATCNTIEVGSIVVPPPPDPPPVTPPPVPPLRGLTVTSSTPEQVIVEWSSDDCRDGVTNRRSGSNDKKRITITCTH